MSNRGAAYTGTVPVQVTVDRTPPTVTLTLSEHSDYAHVSGDTLYYAENSGSFAVTAALTDTLAGLAQVTFPDATSPGISYALSGLTTATRYRTYTFYATSTFSATTFVTATDRATNAGTATFTVTRDTTPPQVWLEVPHRVYTTTIPLAWGATDDASGVARYDVQVRVEDGEWTDWLTDTLDTEATYVAESGQWFSFRVTATDNVSNAESAEAAASLVRVTKYYYHGGQRVAMRQVGPESGSVVYYLHGDHLGSTSLTTDASGAVVARQLYHPYGTVRHSDGTLPTDFGFAGQRHDNTGLIFMHARYYHAGLGRFVSADTIVPEAGNPQDFNRYAYVRNSPLNYRDPSGHTADSYGNSWSVVDCPMCEPPSPEKVREVTVFWAIGVPAAVFGGPLLGDLAAAGAAGIASLATPTAAMAKTRLMFGTAGGVGSGLGYAVPSLVAGDFDWREFAVATGVGFVSGAFPNVGGTGALPGAIRGALANEAQYVLSSAWTGEEMSWKEAQWAAGAGVLTGGASECIGISASAHFDSAITQAELFNWRSAYGAANFARDSLEVYINTASGPALQEGGRTLLWETVNNVLTTDYSD